MWIVIYRDFSHPIGTMGDEEAFIHPSSKVFIYIITKKINVRFLFHLNLDWK